MKKLLLYTTLMTGMLMSSCDLDINDDPDYPTNDVVTPDLVFPAVEAAIAGGVGSQIYNYAGFLAQYFEQAPEAQQYDEIAYYRFREASDLMGSAYRDLYAGALNDAQYVIQNSTNASDRFAATVLRAYAYQVLVDNLDKCPYTEALKGSEALNPKWDNGEDVYKGVLAEMDKAEAELEGAKLTSKDLIFDRDIDQWIGFANALRVRMYLRLIDGGVDAAEYETKLKALVDQNKFMTSDAAFGGFSDETDKRSPWYETNFIGLAANHCLAYPLISYLEATGDPRIEYGISRRSEDNTYAGQLPGGKEESRNVVGTSNWRNKHVSMVDYSVGAVKPVCFFTVAELKFLLSEIYLRFYNDDARAQAAYEEGIRTDFAARGIDGADAFIASEKVNWASNTDKMYLIGMQKWVALYYMDHMEAWSEIRRTDIPKLSGVKAAAIFSEAYNDGPASGYTPGDRIDPWANDLGAGRMINRMYYPLSARQYNTSTPASPEPDTHVWWDKN